MTKPARRFLAITLVLLAGQAARAGSLTDTLSGLTPGEKIGCNYTFSNGNPSIPCAQDTVGADGTVTFVKPNAPFDGIDYFDATTGNSIETFSGVAGVPLLGEMTIGDFFPVLETSPGFSSFFDVFSDITIPEPLVTLDEAFSYTDGTNSSLPGITIPGFTGTATVIGFDEVGSVPEPGTVWLLSSAIAGLAAWLCVKKRSEARWQCLKALRNAGQRR